MVWYQRSLKRLFDFVVALSGIVLVAPLFVIICVGIKLSSQGSLLFVQNRIGQGGKPIRVVKFRTMVVGSHTSGSVTKAGDKRITPIGAFLRRYKLDELPQLWNVLTGTMSLVGPRPDVAGYADKLSGDDRCILALKPGITGVATIFFRYEEEILAAVNDPQQFNDTVLWPLKVKINKTYLDNWHFWNDIGLIAITIMPSLNSVVQLVPKSPRSPEELHVGV